MSYTSSMPPFVGCSIAVLMIITGSVTVVCPKLVSRFQEDDETSPEAAIWQIRIGSILMLLFGAAMLHAILTAKGLPDFIGV
jgi:hypothetical protein